MDVCVVCVKTKRQNAGKSRQQTVTYKVERENKEIGSRCSYGLEGLGIESRWGRDLLYTSIPDLVPTQLPMQWVPGLFTWGKAAGAWR
jgi:hypothetical protein